MTDTWVQEELATGLVFPECGRWHEGKLWLSDMHAHRVCTVDDDGQVTTVVQLDDRPGGLGFLPDGDLLIVVMRTRQLLRWNQERGLSVYADLSGLPARALNDMVVDVYGRAFVGCRLHALGTPPVPGEPDDEDFIVRVDLDGGIQVVAEHLTSPNGSVITADGRTLIVAETRAHRLTAFDLWTDGSLSGRRTYAEVGDLFPDGIALDAAGGVWFGSPVTGLFVRVVEGGEITDQIRQPEGQWAVAVALGGPGRRTLFLLTARTTLDGLAQLHTAADDAGSPSVGGVETVVVPVPGSGFP